MHSDQALLAPSQELFFPIFSFVSKYEINKARLNLNPSKVLVVMAFELGLGDQLSTFSYFVNMCFFKIETETAREIDYFFHGTSYILILLFFVH